MLSGHVDAAGTSLSADARALRVAGWLAVALAAALGVIAAANGGRGRVAVLAAFVLAAAGFLAMPRTVPAAAALAFAVAISYAALGWAFELFERVVPFDEIAHVVTGFGFTPVLAFLVLAPWLSRWREERLRIAFVTVSLGVAAGAAWEMAEWIAREVTARETITHSLNDAITDMMLGGIGSTLSLALVFWSLATRFPGGTGRA
jgi:hypothetical protein